MSQAVASSLVRPTIFPNNLLQIVDRALALKPRRCSKTQLLAVADFLSGCRIDFGEAVDWITLETAIKDTGLTIDQILNALSKEPANRPEHRTFQTFELDYEVWAAFRKQPEYRDASDIRCWLALSESRSNAKHVSGGTLDCVRFVRNVVRATGLPIDLVLDSLGAGDQKAERGPIRSFHRFWLKKDDWDAIPNAGLDSEKKFLFACRWGYGRLAGNDCAEPRPLTPDQEYDIAAIKTFRADALRQLSSLANTLDHLLELADGNERLAFKALMTDGQKRTPALASVEADTIVGAMQGIDFGFRLSINDVDGQVQRLEQRICSPNGVWTLRDLMRERALLARLDDILDERDDIDGDNLRHRLDSLLEDYTGIYNDVTHDIQTGMIDLTEPQGENLGQLTLAELAACLHLLELRNPDIAGLAERINLKFYREQLCMDRLLLQSLEARLMREPFAAVKALRDRLQAVNIDQERRERFVDSLLV